MKQKVVVKVSMNGQKCRCKAMKIAVSVSGVESATLKGDEIEVTGDGIDPVVLTRSLRKNVGYAELVSVQEKKDEKKEDKKDEPTVQQMIWSPSGSSVPYPIIYEVPPSQYGPPCSIM